MKPTTKTIIIASLIVLGTVTLLYYGYRKFFKKLKKSGKFLFVGDSITANASSYADQLKANNPEMVIKKIAKVGEKTDWMLDNLQKELSENKYDAVVILGGINDIYAKGQISDAKLNLQKMYDLAHDKGAKVIGVTPPPTGTYSAWSEKKQELQEQLNAFVMKNPALDYKIDFYSLLSDGVNQKKQYLTDGLHPNATGHKELKDKFSTILT